MAKKETLTVPEDVIDYMQRLAYELEARQAIVDHIISSHSQDEDASVLDSVIFKHYMTALVEVTAEYEMAKNEFPKKVFPDKMDKVSSWDLNYNTKQVTLTYA